MIMSLPIFPRNYRSKKEIKEAHQGEGAHLENIKEVVDVFSWNQNFKSDAATHHLNFATFENETHIVLKVETLQVENSGNQQGNRT
jgi:hypothetical protein